eukprot:SAG22_NODE_22_length_31438_cov_47.016529_7_plen_80_part_00
MIRITAHVNPVGESLIKVNPAAYGRNFTKHALSRVPSDSDGLPVSENAGEFIVEKILGERTKDGVTEYEVKWKGYDEKV